MEVPRRFIERDFLISSKLTWTDMMRDRENREASSDLKKQLLHAKSDEEKEQVKEALYLLNSEIDQWEMIDLL